MFGSEKNKTCWVQRVKIRLVRMGARRNKQGGAHSFPYKSLSSGLTQWFLTCEDFFCRNMWSIKLNILSLSAKLSKQMWTSCTQTQISCIVTSYTYNASTLRNKHSTRPVLCLYLGWVSVPVYLGTTMNKHQWQAKFRALCEKKFGRDCWIWSQICDEQSQKWDLALHRSLSENMR